MSKSKPQYSDAKEKNGKRVKSKQSLRLHIYTHLHTRHEDEAVTVAGWRLQHC